jgi:N-acetylglucosaminyl-diphospho-decaprenol L-rhamnosyltransferase
MGTGCALTWIVVTHDSARDLKSFLPSLDSGLEALRRRGCGVDVLVADNDSHDGTASVVADFLPSARFLPSHGNLGFGAAVNRAVGTTASHWLAFSNADLFIPEGGLDRLGEVLDATAPDVAIIGPAVTSPYGHRDPTCGRFPTLVRLIAGLGRTRPWARHPVARGATRTVDWVTGACMFVRRDVFLALGGFDEDFFLYYEDVDLALRMGRRGHRTVVEPGLSAIHVHPHHVRGRRDGHIEGIVRASRRAYFAKHRPVWEQRLLSMLEWVERGIRPPVPASEGSEELHLPVPDRR